MKEKIGQWRALW